jgi:hypothetical protein
MDRYPQLFQEKMVVPTEDLVGDLRAVGRPHPTRRGTKIMGEVSVQTGSPGLAIGAGAGRVPDPAPPRRRRLEVTAEETPA